MKSCLQGVITDTGHLIGKIGSVSDMEFSIALASEHLKGAVSVVCDVIHTESMYLYSADGYALADKNGVILLSR